MALHNFPKLDRRIPSSWNHVEKYPGNALRKIARTVDHVEQVLSIPKRYVAIYDQGKEGQCVGYGCSIMMSYLNRKLYDASWLYREAQIVDEWDDTPPQEGTSLRAGFDVLRDQGHRQLWGGQSKPPQMQHGIVKVNRWLTSIDEVRTAIAQKEPVLWGVDWFQTFYKPQPQPSGYRGKTEHWLAPKGGNWGRWVGGHAICQLGCSDRRQAIMWQNSWGADYPPVWVPYESAELLLKRNGEAAIVTDR